MTDSQVARGERIAELTRLYEQDQKKNAKAVSASDIPISYDAITPEWLSAILCKDHPGARVVAFSEGDRDEGSTNRRRLFIEYNSKGTEQGLPESVFCKATHGLKNRIMLGLSNCIQNEVLFYRKVRPHLNFEAPSCYFAAFDPNSFNSMIILRDIGKTADFYDYTRRTTKEQAEQAVRILAALHGGYYQNERLNDLRGDIKSWAEQFADITAIEGYAEHCHKGLMAAEDVVPDRLIARADEIWPATLQSVELHAGRPSTLCHGDVHLKNWYITKGGTVGLSDWQVICIGHWSRDLAYAISTMLTVDDRRTWEKELVRLYLDCLPQVGGPTVPLEEAWTCYRRQLLGVLAWWTIVLTPAEDMPDMQPADVTIEIISRITHAIDDLDALDSY